MMLRKVIQNAVLASVVILGIVVFPSCRPSMPVKLLPAYTLNINFPSQQGIIAVEQGSSVIIPVMAISLIDQPIGIRLILTSSVGQLPAFIKYEAPQEFAILSPDASFSTQLTISVSADAPPGDYNVVIEGELQEAIKDRNPWREMFRLTVTATPASSPVVSGATISSPIMATQSPSSTPIPSATQSHLSLNAFQVISEAISASEQTTSFSLDSDITTTLEYFNNGPASEGVFEWDGSRSVDLSNKELQMAMDIDSLASNVRPSTELIHYIMYITGNYAYDMGYHYPTFPGSNISFPWSKTPLDDNLWKAESQISSQVEMLRDFKDAALLGNETLDGVDCFVLQITPSDQAVAGCIESQRQGPGIQLVLPQETQGSIFKVWVSQDSGQIIKSDLSALFAFARRGGTQLLTPGITPPTPTPTVNTTAEFHGQWNFSSYNQAVSIKLPPEALAAIER